MPTNRKELSRARRPGHPVKDYHAPQWVKRIGPYLLSLFDVVVGCAWTGFIPPPSFFAAEYLLPSAAWMGLGWWWIGVEPIPGRRPAKKRLQGNWLVPAAGLALTLAVGSVLNVGTYLAPAFAWVFFGAALKLSVYALFFERHAYCNKCDATRWFQRYDDAWYCPRCGRRLESEPVV